ncbi:MAG TPA: TlpA disulfide reductase family protein [Candidatus Acidoferrales bacterium]|jgi:peroxiredoxin|nr:TlpA disulfide reductase family protein [Candidatus Acidoferrales bacterium]
MNRQKVKGRLLALVLIASALALASVPASRKSPEFTIYETSGKATPLSSLKGKVVVMEFLFIRSEHCLRVAQTLNKLHSELGSRGFQPVGVVFDPPNGANASVQSLALMVDYFKLTYPVGHSAKADVDSYLGRTGNEILNIPQIVVIDRAGMIRATSGGAGGDPRLEDENSLRNLINDLLEEGKATSPNRR